jgi:hypothetical protein
MTIDEVMTRARRSGGGAAGDASDAMAAAAATTPAAIMAIFEIESSENGRWDQNNHKTVLFCSLRLDERGNTQVSLCMSRKMCTSHSPDLQSMRIHQPFPRGSRKP